MIATRSLHPPGGAMALTAVLTHAHAWLYPLFPGMTNSLLLVLAGVAYNTVTGRRYPHAQGAAITPAPSPGQPTHADPLDEVLRRYNQVLDVSRDDLEALLHETERLAYRQRLNELRCENIMSRHLVKVQFGTPLQDAWNLLHKHQIKALPVVDQYDHLVGIVTLADFMRHAEINTQDALTQRLRQFLKATPGMNSSKPEVVGQIMTRQVRVASANRPLAELVPLFTRDGHHHIPIVGDKRKLVGIVTQSDFLRAWSKAVHEGWHHA
jgi:CBS domain-containing membrane protein